MQLFLLLQLQAVVVVWSGGIGTEHLTYGCTPYCSVHMCGNHEDALLLDAAVCVVLVLRTP